MTEQNNTPIFESKKYTQEVNDLVNKNSYIPTIVKERRNK